MIYLLSESQDSCGHFEPKISPIGRLGRDFRTWKDRKALLQPQHSILRGCPRQAVEHFLTVDYSILEANKIVNGGHNCERRSQNRHKKFEFYASYHFLIYSFI